MVTKRVFEGLADCLLYIDGEARAIAAVRIGEFLERENHRFNWKKWMEACHVEKGEDGRWVARTVPIGLNDQQRQQ